MSLVFEFDGVPFSRFIPKHHKPNGMRLGDCFASKVIQDVEVDIFTNFFPIVLVEVQNYPFGPRTCNLVPSPSGCDDHPVFGLMFGHFLQPDVRPGLTQKTVNTKHFSKTFKNKILRLRVL